MGLGALTAAVLVGGCAGEGGSDVASPASPSPRETAAWTGAEWRTPGCATPRSPQTVESGGATMPVNPPDLEAVLQRLAEQGPARFDDVYAGVEVDQDQVRAIVYRVPSAGFDEFVRDLAGNVCVVVRDAAHSAADLSALMDRISADVEYWKSRGIRIHTWGPRHDGAGVEVGTEDVAKAKVELPARYGTAVPILVKEQGPVMPVPAHQ